MKKLIYNYTFDPEKKTITFNDYDSIELKRVLLVVNVTRNEIIYNFTDPSRGGSVSDNVLTLNYDTTNMSPTDELMIFYEDPNLPATEDTLLAIKEFTARIPGNPALEDGNLGAIRAVIEQFFDLPLSSRASEDTLNDLLQLFKMLIQGPLGRLAIDSANRLRTVVESAPTTAVTQSGTWTMGQSGTWMMPTYSNDNIQFQLSFIEYNECQRSKFTFV